MRINNCNKRLLSLLTTLICVNAWGANDVKLVMSLSLNGKESKVSIVTPYGKAGTITETNETGEGFEISITPELATEQNETTKAVNLKFAISEIKSNVKKLVATPVVSTRMGQQAMVTQGKPGARDFELKVVASENM